MIKEPTVLDKILDIRRIKRFLSGNAKYRIATQDQLAAAQQRLRHLDYGHRDMLKAHLEFLDFLTQESDRTLSEEGGMRRDFRVDFVTWYLQNRPEKKLR